MMLETRLSCQEKLLVDTPSHIKYSGKPCSPASLYARKMQLDILGLWLICCQIAGALFSKHTSGNNRDNADSIGFAMSLTGTMQGWQQGWRPHALDSM